MMRSIGEAAREAAIRCRMTSVSTVDWKIEPPASSVVRRCSALIRLPLCAIASEPWVYLASRGCAFLSTVEPAVE